MIVGIVLAAGTSSRLGRPKQLLPHRGRPLVQHAVDAALESGVDEVVVVLGHAAAAVREALEGSDRLRIVVNPAYEEGQATSLMTGLAAAPEEARAAVVLLGDQPGISPGHIRSILRCYAETAGPVVRARYGEAPGHPVLLDRSVWEAVMAITGDRGARDLLRQHPEWVVDVPLGPHPPPDVDTEEDYRRLQEADGPVGER